MVSSIGRWALVERAWARRMAGGDRPRSCGAFFFVGGHRSVVVVAPALEDDEGPALKAIDEAVDVVDAARPLAGQLSFQGLRLADALPCAALDVRIGR